MPRDELKHLRDEVKALINDGVYALYAVTGVAGVSFVLLTNTRETFPLNSDGDIVEGVEIRIGEIELGAPTFFTGLASSRPAAKLNYAA